MLSTKDIQRPVKRANKANDFYLTTLIDSYPKD